jgi:hypothetical protein
MLEFFFHKWRGTALGFKQEGPHEPSCFDPRCTFEPFIFAGRITDDGMFFMCVAELFHSHPIDKKNDPQGEMDGMFKTCHLAGYEKTKTPPSIGCKVQRFPAALQ